MPTENAPLQPVRRFRWSWRVGSIAGIPIRIHLTLAFLLAWIALSSGVAGVGPKATVLGVLLVATVFATIVVHELGHALMARRFGVRTREILLLPIGGIASLEGSPRRASHELAIALVGPAINIAIAGLLWLGIALAGGSLELGRSTGESFVVQLVWINLALAVFNLIPAFPMDGGRALRALLAMWLGRERATDIAVGLGKLFAVALGVFGLLYSPWLVVIALVVWFGARGEAELVRLRAAIASVPVRDAMTRQIETVALDDPLERAARLLITTGQNQLPIVDHGTPVGVLTRNDLAAVIAAAPPDAPVAAAPHHEVVTVSPDDPLDRVFDQLVTSPEAIAVVVDHGTPVGILTTDQLATFVALQSNPTR